MAQKSKVANRKLVLVLAALFAITLVGLNITVTVYFSEMNNKNAQIKNLSDQLRSIEAQLTNQTVTIVEAKARLIGVGMQYNDNRTNPAAPFLHVTGYAVNVGAANATNCNIKIFATQTGNNTALDDTVALNSLAPGAYQKIDVQFPYTGGALLAFSSNLDWKS